MPIYEYRCDKGHELEILQRMSEDSLSSCRECGAPAQRVFSAPAVHFKGSGFYTTDYARKPEKGSSESSSESSSDKSSSSDSSSATDTKTSKSESSSSSSSPSSNGSGSSSD